MSENPTKQEKDRLYYQQHKERVKARQNLYYHQNRQRILEQKRAESRDIKAEAMAVYGGKCVCCAERQIEFLTIDHISGGGNAHRRQVGRGKHIYRDLQKRGWPQGDYRVLCFNCNIALGFYGYCPHGNIGPVLKANDAGPQFSMFPPGHPPRI